MPGLAPRPVISGRQGSEGVGRGVVTEDTRRGSYNLGLGAAHAVDLVDASDAEHTTSHVVHLAIGDSRRLGGPGVGARVVLEWVGEVGPRDVRVASSDGIEASVRREVVARRAHRAYGWEDWTARPTRGATWRWRRGWRSRRRRGRSGSGSCDTEVCIRDIEENIANSFDLYARCRRQHVGNKNRFGAVVRRIRSQHGRESSAAISRERNLDVRCLGRAAEHIPGHVEMVHPPTKRAH